MTEDEELAVAKMLSDYLPEPKKDREFTARNIVRLTKYLHGRHGEINVVTQGIDSKVQVSYDGLHWTIKEITS